MGLSLKISFNFYQHKLMEGLKDKKQGMPYQDTLAWYNKQLFMNEAEDNNSEPEDKDDSNKEEDPNEAYHRRQLQQWKDQQDWESGRENIWVSCMFGSLNKAINKLLYHHSDYTVDQQFPAPS